MATPKPPVAGPIRVRCTAKEGFAFGNRVRTGMTFTIPDMTHFSERWMELVDPSTPDDLAAKIQPKKKRITDTGVRTKSGTIVHGPAAAPGDPTPAPTGAQSVI